MNNLTESEWRNYREMNEHLHEICVEATRECESIESEARVNCEAIGLVCIRNFDLSYIEFLKEQIRLQSRGPEWNKRLQKRVDNLSAYIGRELADCRLRFGHLDYSIKIDPIKKKIIHWESYHEST